MNFPIPLPLPLPDAQPFRMSFRQSLDEPSIVPSACRRLPAKSASSFSVLIVLESVAAPLMPAIGSAARRDITIPPATFTSAS